MKRALCATALVALTLLASYNVVAGATAQPPEEFLLVGSVEHGSPESSFDPRNLRVRLDVIEGVSSIAQDITTPDLRGRFEFITSSGQDRTFFLTVDYQGAVYSATHTASQSTDPVRIVVFDSTHDIGVLTFDSYTVIVAGADEDEGFVEIMERAIVRNSSDRTLIPDPSGEGPAMLSFLRFALPAGAYNLDVRSNLVGGQVLEVDRGFALTTPITPTYGEPHQFEFVYRLRYHEPTIDLSRTMRFGAESFRFVAIDDVARPSSPQLEDLGATDMNGRLLRLLEGSGLTPGEVVELSVSGLPTRSTFAEVRRIAGAWYVLYALPASVGIVGLVLLLIAARHRNAVSPLPGTAQRDLLLTELSDLRTAYVRDAIDGEAYGKRFNAIREELLTIEFEARLSNATDEGGRKT